MRDVLLIWFFYLSWCSVFCSDLNAIVCPGVLWRTFFWPRSDAFSLAFSVVYVTKPELS